MPQATNTLLDDSQFFGVVAKDLTLNQQDEGLWTMAVALENGDEAKTKAHYIRLRVKQLLEKVAADHRASLKKQDSNRIDDWAQREGGQGK